MERTDLLHQLELLHADSFGWALACCRRDREEAEDVLQIAYEAVLDGRARYHGRSNLRTWLFGVIRLTALAHRRRRLWRWLRWERSLDGHDPADARSDAATNLMRSESVQELQRALSSLSRRQQEILHLVFYQDLTIDAAAQVLGITVGTARQHYERGKEKLRALLADKRP